jgi:excisionase family DNA binding protein
MSEAKNTNEKLSTVQEFAQRFRVVDKTVYRWVNSGQVEAIQAGRRLLFEESEIKRFMDLRRRAAKRKAQPATAA